MKTIIRSATALLSALIAFSPAAQGQTFECVDGVDFHLYPQDTAAIVSVFGEPGDTIELPIYWKADSAIIGLLVNIRYPANALTPVILSDSINISLGPPVDVFTSGRAATSDKLGSITSRMIELSFKHHDSALITVRWLRRSSQQSDSIPGGAGEILRVRFVVNRYSILFHPLPITLEHLPVVATVDSVFVQFGCELTGSAQYRHFANGVFPILAVPILLSGTFTPLACCKTPGDFNRDGVFNIADISDLVRWLFLDGAPARCAWEADSDGDGRSSLSDVVYGIAYLFRGGPTPRRCPPIE